MFLRSGNVRRVLFLVDRLELEDQAKKAFAAVLSADFQTVIYKECAHATQRIARVMLSTRIVAKCIHRVLDDILYDLMHEPGRLRSSVERAISYLAANARRAKPE